MTRSRLVRAVAATTRASGGLRVGAGDVELTPGHGMSLAGYSLGNGSGERTLAPLHARAIAIEDRAGRRVVFLVLDLLSGSRWLLERIAQHTAHVGISSAELIVCGTHTHTGPGGFFGNSLYDSLASSTPGFHSDVAEHLALRAATAVIEARAKMAPARIAIEHAPLWGVTRQAVPEAFEANRDAAEWWSAGYPGQSAPADLDPRHRAVDPTLVTLAAWGADGLIAALGIFGMHATALGEGQRAYSPDWPGHACDHARASLGAHDATIAIAASSAGDTNALHDDIPQGEALVRHRGVEVGNALAAAIVRTEASASDDVAIEARFGEARVRDRMVNGDPETELADWCFGLAALEGGEDAPSPFASLLSRFRKTGGAFEQAHPQHPKRRALGPMQGLLRAVVDLAPSPVWPMHVVRVGEHLFATVPGEPTSFVNHRIARRLVTATGARDATVIGYAGDYAGYFTTEEEFGKQAYEGASTLFGRHSARHVERVLERIATGAHPTPSDREITFETR